MALGRWRGHGRAPAATAEVLRRSDRPVVVAALPLKADARAHLADALGHVEVLDLRDGVPTADLVLAPSCSPQAIAALKHAYPRARVVVVELDDEAWDIRLSGPVKRLLDAGADAYLTADSIVDLSAQLTGRRDGHTPVAAAQQNALEGRSADDVIMATVADLMRERTETTVVPGPERER